MSDYTTPAVSDESVKYLANAINSFYTEISGDVGNINGMLAEVITKYYSVNHEPQIELPFEAEYEYIKNKVNKSLASSKKLDNFTHIFISGFLPNGKTIHYNALEKDGKGFTVSKYAGLYINGTQTYNDYTCRAEEGGWERLNVLIIGAPKMSPYAARLDIDYADIPLKDFKMIVFDDAEEPVSPDIDSFLDSQEIDTLICYGDFKWTYDKPSTLRVFKGNKNLSKGVDMYLGNLQEFIFPNISSVPNLDSNSNDKTNIRKLDISNCRGAINYLQGAQLFDDLTLVCSSISGSAFKNAKLNRVDVGNVCSSIGDNAFQNSSVTHVTIGYLTTQTYNASFGDCYMLESVIFKNLNPIALGFFNDYGGFEKCTLLRTIDFSYIKSVTSRTFSSCTSLTNLTFIDKSISCNLYFNASPVLTEESCLNIINAIADDAKITVSLHATVKNLMQNSWYCKLSGDKYITCTADDADAITQAEALIARGGTLS